MRASGGEQARRLGRPWPHVGAVDPGHAHAVARTGEQAGEAGELAARIQQVDEGGEEVHGVGSGGVGRRRAAWHGAMQQSACQPRAGCPSAPSARGGPGIRRTAARDLRSRSEQASLRGPPGRTHEQADAARGRGRRCRGRLDAASSAGAC
ncbi:MAG: hypothetical protein ACK559_35530, partial [bacterium]